MAFILKLYDGTTTIDFISKAAGYSLADGGLTISAPKKKQIWGGDSIYVSGSSLVASTFNNREINIVFRVTGSSRDSVGDKVSAIERIIENARNRSIEQVGTRVELQYAWDGSSTTTYFEVIDGEINWPKDVMSVDQVHQTNSSGEYIIFDMELSLTVFPFTYKTSPVSGSPTEIGVSNTATAKVTGGVVVFNHNDGATHQNWIEIDAADVDGDYPALTKLILKAESGEAEKTSKIYMGVRKGDQTFVHTLEDDDATFVIASATPTSQPDDASGDTYTNLVFSGTTEQALIQWGLTNAQTEATKGPFRIFGRAKLSTHWDNAANYRVRILYGSAVMYEGEWRRPLDSTTELFDFGTFFLPPWLVGSLTDIAGLTIEIQGVRATAGTTTIALDYLCLMPQDGGYRVIDFRNTGATQFDYVVDDGWTDTVYHINSSSKKTGLPFGLMPRLRLVPNVKQRIYFLMEGTAKTSDITRQLKVQVYTIPVFNTMS